MVVQGIVYCDLCAAAVFDDDLTTIHITDANGSSTAFQFHNTLQQPCLKNKIEQIRQRFAASANQQ